VESRAGNAVKNGKSRATADGVLLVPTSPLAALLAQLERRAAESEAIGATAPVGAVLRAIIGELQALDGTASLGSHGDKLAAVDGRPDQLLTAQQVAARLAISVKVVYRRAGRWPFTRRLSPGILRFSERGLQQWLERTARPR